MGNDRLYPISEIFTSPQGEGVYAGTMMTFVRLAGCTVGKPFPKERYGYPPKEQRSGIWPAMQALPIYTEQCTLYDGREFPCDTDYSVKDRMTAKEIINHIPRNITRVCITGGEPLMHKDVQELLDDLYYTGKLVHIETSGTIAHTSKAPWITVSPKWKCLPSMIDRADELKILVDRDFLPDQFLDIALSKPVYLQPVNSEHSVIVENLALCLKWQKLYPQFRISLQLHKVLSDYLKEQVR